jgi:hypothetical protein
MRRKSKRRRNLSSGITESQIQIALVEWLEKANFDLEFLSIPNEGAWRRRDLKAMGLRRGAADLCFWGMRNIDLAWVELKLKKGRQSENQKIFQATADARGVPYILIKTDDPLEAIEILKGYIKKWTSNPASKSCSPQS